MDYILQLQLPYALKANNMRPCCDEQDGFRDRLFHDHRRFTGRYIF